MVRISFSIIVIALLAGPAWSLTFMGPPTSGVKKGDFGLGFDVSMGELDVELSGYGQSATAEMETSNYFARLLFGLADNAEFSVRLGLSDIEEDASGGFDSSTEFAWGLGAKGKIAGSAELQAGLLFQLTSIYGDDSAIIGPYIVEGDFDAYEIQLATGLTYKADQLCIYGGPFLHLITGDLDASVGPVDLSLDLEQESEFGGYAGIALQLADNTNLAVEYQVTSDADVIGIGLMHRFGDKKPQPKAKPPADPAGRKIKGYKATINPATGKPEKTPVYEEK
jgi:hypothetical protein